MRLNDPSGTRLKHPVPFCNSILSAALIELVCKPSHINSTPAEQEHPVGTLYASLWGSMTT